MLLREKYKTYDGAHKRCAFENSLAKSEYENGYKTKLYHYTVVLVQETLNGVTIDGTWRIQRNTGV